MLELLRKAYLLGLGLASLTREKVEEFVDDLVQRGEIAEKDRRKVLDDLLSRAREEQEKLSRTVKDNVRKVVSELGVPRRSEFEDLVRKVEELERKLKEQSEADGPNVSTPEGS